MTAATSTTATLTSPMMLKSTLGLKVCNIVPCEWRIGGTKHKFLLRLWYINYNNSFYYCSLKTYLIDDKKSENKRRDDDDKRRDDDDKRRDDDDKCRDDDKRPADELWYQVNQEMTAKISAERVMTYPVNIKDFLICDMSPEFIAQLKTLSKTIIIV
jgi:hypothetical protein